MSLYFAYGSNMHGPQMRARCPKSKPAGFGFLPGHELVFAGHSRTWGGAVATVRKRAGMNVLGLLYRLGAGDLGTLDRYEGYPSSYDRKTATIDTMEGPVRAVYYFKPGRLVTGRPSAAYLDIILAVHRKYGVPFNA